ncbi:TRAP transporter small permease [Desulfotomaculum nigrificans]|uniref:TRAP transporter small permease n=1 Tax=Desulfotomaculum nigrificans TaxID=1565 RepID=UPI0001FADE17|nr:TRAP transporter small permease [Desulfotomaculum nigrificans]
MKKLKLILDKVLEFGALLCIVGFIVVVVLQVFARFALPQAPSWTEEAARYLFIYMICFAGGLAVRDKAFATVDTLIGLLPKTVKSLLLILIDLVLVGFMMVIAYKGIDFIKLGSIQTSPTLIIPMSIPQASITFVAICISIYLVIQIFQTIKGLCQGGGR